MVTKKENRLKLTIKPWNNKLERSSLARTFSLAQCLKFRQSHRGLYYKTLRIRNLRNVDTFCGKLVYFTGSDKHTNLLRNPYITYPWGFMVYAPRI
jgi:hypothetical protein